MLRYVDLLKGRFLVARNCTSGQFQIANGVVKMNCPRRPDARMCRLMAGGFLALRHRATASSDTPIPARIPAPRNACKLVWRRPPAFFPCENAGHGRHVHFRAGAATSGHESLAGF